MTCSRHYVEMSSQRVKQYNLASIITVQIYHGTGSDVTIGPLVL